jgi:hypothetical protein
MVANLLYTECQKVWILLSCQELTFGPALFKIISQELALSCYKMYRENLNYDHISIIYVNIHLIFYYYIVLKKYIMTMIRKSVIKIIAG